MSPSFPQATGLLAIFDLVLHYNGSDLELKELSHRKAVLGEKHHSNVAGLIQICRIAHMRVKVHVSPTCE